MKTRARQEALLDGQLRRAQERGEFVLWYQPQVDLRTGRIVGAEALLRWNRPGVGLVQPGAFLARAEENGFIGPIDEWAMMEACNAALRWQACAQGAGVGVAVNLSPTQFRDRSTPLLVARALGASGSIRGCSNSNSPRAACSKASTAPPQTCRCCATWACAWRSMISASAIPRSPTSSGCRSTRIKIDQSFVRDLRAQCQRRRHRARDPDARPRHGTRDSRGGRRERGAGDDCCARRAATSRRAIISAVRCPRRNSWTCSGPAT